MVDGGIHTVVSVLVVAGETQASWLVIVVPIQVFALVAVVMGGIRALFMLAGVGMGGIQAFGSKAR